MTFPPKTSSEQIVLVDFYADWCEPCKWAEPVIDEVINFFSGKMILRKIDIDKQPDVAREFHVLSVPTLVLFKQGKEVWRMRGFDTAPVLTRAMQQFVD